MKNLLSLLLILAGLHAQAAEKAGLPAGDLGRLQGRWKAMAGPRKEIRVVLEIKGRDVSVDIKTPKGLDFQAQGELNLDESTSPRRLDWRKFSGPDQQPLPDIAAVYKIEGDTFTVCNGGVHGSRPKDFKPGEGVLADVVVFQRLDEQTQHTGAAEKHLVRNHAATRALLSAAAAMSRPHAYGR
jgi:uncharacterized protein (TIGR03067 family)